MKTNQTLANGVYFLLNNGTFVTATGEQLPSKEQIEMIGVAHDGHYFAIPLNWDIYGEKPLVTKVCEYDVKFCKSEAAALCDWDFVSATKHLQKIGLTFKLDNGHYLPTLAVLFAMFHNKEAVNSALAMAGAKGIDFGPIMWSSSRCDRNHVWGVHGNVGFLYYFNTHHSRLVIPTSPWEPIF